jgi:hypothetical protein
MPSSSSGRTTVVLRTGRVIDWHAGHEMRRRLAAGFGGNLAIEGRFGANAQEGICSGFKQMSLYQLHITTRV